MTKDRNDLNIAARITVLLIMFLMLFAAVTPERAQAKTRTYRGRTQYDVVKKGKTIYCSAGNKLFAVNARTGKKKVLLRKKSALCMTPLVTKGKYLYFCVEGGNGGIYRMNRKNKKIRRLAKGSGYMAFAVGKKHIYYQPTIFSNKKYRMTLSGKHKKSVKGKIDPRQKGSNAKGYKKIIKAVYDDIPQPEYDYKIWLKGKNIGKVYLGVEYGE